MQGVIKLFQYMIDPIGASHIPPAELQRGLSSLMIAKAAQERIKKNDPASPPLLTSTEYVSRTGYQVTDPAIEYLTENTNVGVKKEKDELVFYSEPETKGGQPDIIYASAVDAMWNLFMNALSKD